jgi:hypothetical protein
MATRDGGREEEDLMWTLRSSSSWELQKPKVQWSADTSTPDPCKE